MENKFFLHQIKRNNGTITKGIVVKDTYEAAKQGVSRLPGRLRIRKRTGN